MSVSLTTSDGWIISHLDYITEIYNKYPKRENQKFGLNCYKQLFKINCQYLRDNQFSKAIDGVLKDDKSSDRKRKSRKRKLEIDDSIFKEIQFVKNKFETIVGDDVKREIYVEASGEGNNKGAREGSNDFFKRTFQEFKEFFGRNLRDEVVVQRVGEVDCVFPGNCEFYSNDVRDIEGKLDGREFDFVLMDPPWWNKFVRRTKERKSETG